MAEAARKLPPVEPDDPGYGGGPPSASTEPMDKFINLLRKLYPLWEQDTCSDSPAKE